MMLHRGLYPGRTRHIHAKVQAPGQPILATQLFFLGEPRNAQDGIYRDSVLLTMPNEGATRTGKFNFVLDLA